MPDASSPVASCQAAAWCDETVLDHEGPDFPGIDHPVHGLAHDPRLFTGHGFPVPDLTFGLRHGPTLQPMARVFKFCCATHN